MEQLKDFMAKYDSDVCATGKENLHLDDLQHRVRSFALRKMTARNRTICDLPEAMLIYNTGANISADDPYGLRYIVKIISLEDHGYDLHQLAVLLNELAVELAL